MFLTDHETATDLLYYEVISKTVVRLIQDAGERPISVGVHGDWGAGKSSILAMAEEMLRKEDGVVCVWFNGWQFQGFEDAKTVLIERILAAFEENKTVLDNAGAELASLLRRVRWFKVARKVGGLLVSAKTGLPVGSLTEWVIDYFQEKGGNAADTVENAEKLGECLDEKEAKSMPKEMEAFRRDFEKLLTKAGIKRLVVLIDDLDRCLPHTAVETLEAIKLFLFVPRAVFVIAADEAMIEYAVRRHFPDLPIGAGPLTYARNYLEKLIQVPFRIPAMGIAETRVYIALLDVEASTTNASKEFQALRDLARDVLRKPWESQLFERSKLRARLGVEKLPQSVERAITLSDQLAPMLAEQTKGNPRQVKRFLNALLLRHAIANARGFGDEIKTSVLAKIMLVERFFGKFYDVLALEVAASRGGSVEALKEWESGTVDRTTRAANPFAEWADSEDIRVWARSTPPVADEDLRPYILITRDRRNPFAVASSENEALVEKLLSNKLIVAGASKELKALGPDKATSLFDEVSARIRSKEEYGEMPNGAAGLAELVKTHPELQQRLLDFAAQLPTAKLGPWVIGDSGWQSALKGPFQGKWKELVMRWAEQTENKRLQKAARAIITTIA